nr:hypothetical protein [Tanacetum cinerariifolium]
MFILRLVLNGPFKYGTITVTRTLTTPATVRDKIYDELIDVEKIREDRVKLLIEGSKISLQERESKLYDEFNMFTLVPGETIHTYYLRFTQLINDMYSIGMTLMPIQINIKFINHLQPEWSKFVTNVKLAKDLHDTNFDHLWAYQPQDVHHSSVVHHQSYQAPPHQPLQALFPLMDSRLLVPSFLPTDDPIVNLNKAMDFIIIAFTSRYLPITTSLEPRLTQGIRQLSKMEELPCRQFKEDKIRGQAKVIRCHNYQEEGHMTRQHNKPKRLRNSTWFKEKAMLVEALESRMSQEIATLAAFQTDDLDAFDSDCDEAPSSSAILMAKIFSYDSEVLSEVPIHDNYINNHVIDQNAQEMQYSE